MSDSEKQIRRALETYKSAVLAKNVDAFMHLYDPEVRVFDTWGVWSYDGAEAWRIAVEGWFSSLQGGSCNVSFAEVRIVDGQNTAAMSAVATYTGVSSQGQAVRAMQNRISWVLKTSGHVWRVVHEHTSVPIGFDDAKGMLQSAGKH